MTVPRECKNSQNNKLGNFNTAIQIRNRIFNKILSIDVHIKTNGQKLHKQNNRLLLVG